MHDWSGLLSDAREVVRELWRERLLPVGALVRQVLAYARWLRSGATVTTDLNQAERLVRANIELLGHTMYGTEHERRLAQVATRYFVKRVDGDDDLLSPYGFDDDVEVFNVIATRLGLSHRQLSIVHEPGDRPRT